MSAQKIKISPEACSCAKSGQQPDKRTRHAPQSSDLLMSCASTRSFHSFRPLSCYSFLDAGYHGETIGLQRNIPEGLLQIPEQSTP